ncbi:hypothetical protein C9J12_29880 [Photobacterium frigidiphilum]|uniref:Uncharacterized protein n=1 Tax=Photobacterium frigidiphilum TaxID=264736 RepID=A0A2T3J5K7_9GAMM|nr:hypothetical protein [Photobacterium frigidiphilum]PSU40228.1 hypothetical protein C9J12_29880 [Photobacterium frigidiphilum]
MKNPRIEPEYSTFLNTLFRLNIYITHQALLIDRLKNSEEWQTTFMENVCTGRHDNITFHLISTLHTHILRARFTEANFKPGDDDVFLKSLYHLSDRTPINTKKDLPRYPLH